MPIGARISLLVTTLALGCHSSAPAGSAGAGPSAPEVPPLEAHPPAVVAPDFRGNASSSPVIFDPLRGGVWTANGDVGTVSYVDVDTRRVVQEIPVGQDIRSVAESPDGQWVAAVDRAAGAVSLLDAETRQVLRSIAVGGHPHAAVWDSANPRWLYVSIEDTGAVAIVDRTAGDVATTIDVGRLPAGLAVNRGRRELYVAHRIDADLTIVDLQTRTVGADVPIADEPFSLRTVPNGKPFAFESIALTVDGTRAWLPHELLAPTHPFVFNETLFPAISVVDLVDAAEVQTDPNDPAGAIAGRKNLFDAIQHLDPDGQPAVVSQLCAVAMHPGGVVAWALACASEDLLKFGVAQGASTELVRSLGGVAASGANGCDHPAGLTLDDTGQRLFVECDQSHTLLTLDTAGGNLVGHTTPYGDPIVLVAADPVDPALRAGLTLFFRANSSKGVLATTFRNWMSCGGCHLDGLGSTNLRLFESLVASDPQTDARIGHVGLLDNFSTAPTPTDPSFDPHDILVAVGDQGGLTADRSGLTPTGQVDPTNPSPDASAVAADLARVIARDLPRGPTWQSSPGDAPNVAWDTAFCGGCHKTEYEAWQKSVHAHAAEDPMVLYAVGVEQGIAGAQYSRLCAGCHDPVSVRIGDVSFQAKRGVTCLGCHDVVREIRAGGNGDLQATAHDWTTDHKQRAAASLQTLTQPEFCGGCHQQFVPGSGLVAITTLDEYHASPNAGITRCVDCHMPKDENGIANHRFPGGNVYLGQKFGDDTLVQAQRANLAGAVSLVPKRVAGGVLVTVGSTGTGAPAHAFPTGVTDIREPWVELQAKDAAGNVLARIGGPSSDADLLPPGAARLGIDVADASGALLLRHELNEAASMPFDVRIPAGEARALFVALPAELPAGTASLDAVLDYRNVRTTFYRAASGDPMGAAPTVEVARVRVPDP